MNRTYLRPRNFNQRSGILKFTPEDRVVRLADDESPATRCRSIPYDRSRSLSPGEGRFKTTTSPSRLDRAMSYYVLTDPVCDSSALSSLSEGAEHMPVPTSAWQTNPTFEPLKQGIEESGVPSNGNDGRKSNHVSDAAFCF